VPLADTLFRRGHLSDHAIVTAWQGGARPAHLDTCDICVTRLVELTRWLDDLRDVAVANADGVFPPERLAAQQAQIFRRLEQLDRPARLLAFPSATTATQEPHHRTWPGWIAAGVTGVAAGLVLGVFADRVVNLQSAKREAARSSASAQVRLIEESDETAMLIGTDVSRPYVSALAAIDEATPSITKVAVTRTGR
jgi:hypothetical protein